MHYWQLQYSFSVTNFQSTQIQTVDQICLSTQMQYWQLRYSFPVTNLSDDPDAGTGDQICLSTRMDVLVTKFVY